MSKKENKKSNQVVRDMKECFRSFNLPVNQNKSIQDNPRNVVFTSQICNDRVCADVSVIHDRQSGYAEIQISSMFRIPAGRLTEVIEFFDLCNAGLPLEHYSVCPCCNRVFVQTVLFLPNDSLPVGKFKQLIHGILEHTYLSFPLIAAVIIGDNPRDASVRFAEGCKGLREMGNDIPNEVVKTILSDMESVINDTRLSIREDDRFDDGFYVYYNEPKQNEFVLCMILQLFKDRALVVLETFPLFDIPNKEIALITESVNWINRYIKLGCMYVDREDKRVKFRKGIMIANNALDKSELKIAIKEMILYGWLFFPAIKDQLSSNESLEAVMARRREADKDSHQ